MFNDYPFYGVALKLMQCEKGHLLSPHTFQMNMIFKKMVKFFSFTIFYNQTKKEVSFKLWKIYC